MTLRNHILSHICSPANTGDTESRRIRSLKPARLLATRRVILWAVQRHYTEKRERRGSIYELRLILRLRLSLEVLGFIRNLQGLSDHGPSLRTR
ncbi:hypothetical protein BaRGS_00011482 [Batillaria attramentaria]|uniref:Uncharacterized protein n=1 Tax=Batillaria attramentaria TaxID=370345 RepID=A0ABD0LCZ0_9CAEN